MNTNNTSGDQILLCVITEDSLEVKVCKILAYALLLAFSLLGNVSIVMVVCRDRNMRTTTNFLIVNMAVSDLLVPVFAMPRACVEIFNGNLRWLIGGVLGETLCKLTSFLQDISTAVSVQSLVAISVDRFYAVWFPLKAASTKNEMCHSADMAYFSIDTPALSLRFQDCNRRRRPNVLLCRLATSCNKSRLSFVDFPSIHNTPGDHHNIILIDSEKDKKPNLVWSEEFSGAFQ